ncbi:putative immunity protein [Geodermatophilus sp. URMC 63]
MADGTREIELSAEDLRAVAAFAARCAREVLAVFAAAHPDDPRPREAVDAAEAFARGGRRGKVLRDTAWAAQRAAREAGDPAVGHAARAAMVAASAAYLHPLADAAQVKHVLGAAAHAARAAELLAGDDPDVGVRHVERAGRHATPAVVDVLSRYPAAPPGGGRVGKLLRHLDRALRGRS